MERFTPEQEKAYSRGFDTGDTIGKMLAIFGPGAAALYVGTFHRYSIDIEIAAMACVFAQLTLLLWLPNQVADRLGRWYASRVK
ncbi:MAG: hypothetical protein ACJAVZ_000063 [Afipia broomeae]|jgi:hypothetical protein